MRPYFFTLLLILMPSGMVLAQVTPPGAVYPGSGQQGTSSPVITLAGVVTDEKDQPLAGVNLVIRGTSTGTVTGANGRFSLSTSASLPLTISASFIGYRRQDVVARGSNFRALSIKMVEEAIMANEVVVSASRVPEDIQKAAVTVESFSSRRLPARSMRCRT